MDGPYKCVLLLHVPSIVTPPSIINGQGPSLIQACDMLRCNAVPRTTYMYDELVK